MSGFFTQRHDKTAGLRALSGIPSCRGAKAYQLITAGTAALSWCAWKGSSIKLDSALFGHILLGVFRTAVSTYLSRCIQSRIEQPE